MIDAANIQARLIQAQQLAAAGRSGEAWMIVSPLYASIQRNGQALRLYALVAHQTNRWAEVIAALKQVVALENAPPDIVGALADALETAGRSAESAEQWTRLVRLRPDIADAHLNRAVTFTKAGKNVEALAAADEGLSRFPGHPRMLGARATALKNLDRLDEAIVAFERAVAADPARALVRQNQAITLRAACRFEEACAAFAEAASLGLSGSDFRSNWAAAELEAGHIETAAGLYRQAIDENPSNDPAMIALTRLEIEYRGGDAAFDHYEQIARGTGASAAWTNWVQALIANNRYVEASTVGREGISRVDRDMELVLYTAFAEGMSGDADAALGEIERLPASVDELPHGLIAKAQLALRAGDFARTAAWAERYNVTAAETDQIGWNLLSVAWRMLGDPREQWLCDYERLVMVTDVPSPDGKANAADFAVLVAAALDPLHQTLEAPGNQSLRNGTQTAGELFAWPDKTIQTFRDAVVRAAARVVAELPDDPVHPFLRRKSTRFAFSGSWSVRLRGDGGHHVPHFHGHGWMSSAYYARLPQSGPEERDRHDGWIEFGRPPDMYDLNVGPRHVVEPRVGRLVLFPSYMLHGTVPFGASRGDRLTAAFDYQPL